MFEERWKRICAMILVSAFIIFLSTRKEQRFKTVPKIKTQKAKVKVKKKKRPVIEASTFKPKKMPKEEIKTVKEISRHDYLYQDEPEIIDPADEEIYYYDDDIVLCKAMVGYCEPYEIYEGKDPETSAHCLTRYVNCIDDTDISKPMTLEAAEIYIEKKLEASKYEAFTF